MKPEHYARLIELCKAQEAENARLRSLLDEIHRGESKAPKPPARYDSATTEGKR